MCVRTVALSQTGLSVIQYIRKHLTTFEHIIPTHYLDLRQPLLSFHMYYTVLFQEGNIVGTSTSDNLSYLSICIIQCCSKKVT